jgi:hypothetical protein
MAHALLCEAAAESRFVEKIDRALFEHARANALDHVLLRPVLDYDRFDAFEMEQVREQETRWPRADYADLSPDFRHAR